MVDCAVPLHGGSCHWQFQQAKRSVTARSKQWWPSVANWCRTDIILKTETLRQQHSGTFQKYRFGTDDLAQQSCWKPWLQWSGRAHDPGGDRSRPLRGDHNQDCNGCAVGSKPSDTGLGCPTRCLAAHTVPSEELREDNLELSALKTVGWSGLPMNRTAQ